MRLSSGLMGLSSAAILTVYAMGYLQSQPASASNLIDLTSTGTAQPPAAQVPAGQTATSPTQVGYRDGTYVGKGTSRHGDIEATVVIAGGQIVSAKVTNCKTHYPCSDVNRLVDEVLSIQAAPVHHVSGASDSSRAYKQAVVSALAQAS